MVNKKSMSDNPTPMANKESKRVITQLQVNFPRINEMKMVVTRYRREGSVYVQWRGN